MKNLYEHYRHAPINPIERLVIYLRLHFSSYESIESYVPRSGEILDLGCGFGMLTAYLALSSSPRRVKGIDIAERRLKAARFVTSNLSNVTIEYGNFLKTPFQESDCILLIDALHYFPVGVQNELLRKCHGFLRPGGSLLLRGPDKDKTCRYLITKLHETFMTRSGFTKGETLCFRGFVELRSYLEGIGFVVNALPMWRRTPFADTLLVCKT
jgi:SAM-dependent methyltransferase